tara:strand:+ start:532 stop:894 length:363 start_codon:yes stop_codon:yes gene_type:complete
MTTKKMNVKMHSPFVLQRREANLQFPETSEFHGLNVRVKLDVALSLFLEFQKIGVQDATAEDMTYQFKRFGDDILLDWNMVDEDMEAVPASGDGFMTLPPSVCIAIVTAWAENVSQVGEV